MTKDLLGNPLADTAEATVAGINAFVHGFLAYEDTATGVIAVAEADAGSVMANACSGFLWMMLEAPEAPDRAARYLSRCEAQRPTALRERLYADILRAWIADDVPQTLHLIEQGVDAHPRDLVLVKLYQYIAFNQGRFAQMLRIAHKARAAASDIGWLHGMLAFAYEQCHLLEEAEASAREALRLTAKEPWAEHALAHVMLTQGRVDEGALFLEAASPGWTGLNSFMVTHLWWHLAVFYISQGREGCALRLYDDHVWGVARDYSQDQVGAVSLLARLELAGIDVGGRWNDLAPWLTVRADDTTQPFLSLQYLYGLLRAGRPEADALSDAIARRAATAPSHVRETWAEVALPTALAFQAYERRDGAAAARNLGRVLPRMIEIGGSHAQRDLFEQIRLDALIQSGQVEVAQQLLEQRRSFDPDGAPLNEMLAKVYLALDLPDEARKAADRAARTRAAHAAKPG